MGSDMVRFRVGASVLIVLELYPFCLRGSHVLACVIQVPHCSGFQVWLVFLQEVFRKSR